MLGKILLTVIVVAFLWFGFKYLARVAELRRRKEDGMVSPPASPKRDSDAAETMIECRVCGTWQPSRSARACGRSDCPY